MSEEDNRQEGQNNYDRNAGFSGGGSGDSGTRGSSRSENPRVRQNFKPTTRRGRVLQTVLFSVLKVQNNRKRSEDDNRQEGQNNYDRNAGFSGGGGGGSGTNGSPANPRGRQDFNLLPRRGRVKKRIVSDFSGRTGEAGIRKRVHSGRSELMEDLSESIEDEFIRIKKESHQSHEDVARYRQLYIALLHYEWKKAEDFITDNPESLTAIISEFSETIFHNIAESDQDGAIQLLQKYLPKVTEKEDRYGATALFKAAKLGNIKAAKLLVKQNKNLLTKRNKQELLPLHAAGISGHKETVQYLLSETKNSNKDLNLFAGKSGFQLVKILIEANFYDIVSDLLKQNPISAREERSSILEILSGKPMWFESGKRLGFWQSLIYHCIPVQEECIHDCPHEKQKNDLENQNPQNSSKSSPFNILCAWNQIYLNLHIMLWNILMRLAPSIGDLYDMKLMRIYTVKIVRMMCVGVSWSFDEASESLKMPIFTAAKLGIHEIVKEIIKTYPESLIFEDEDKNNILMLAIIHRQEEVFKLVSQFGAIKQFKGNNMKNTDGNNILHLAAKLATASEVPGPALQMQRELQWFKAVENYVQPSLYEVRNAFKKTPREMFTEEHKKLVKEGEKWMKANASSCTIAVSLIITVVFAAVFTTPGGNNNKGIPNFLHQVPFIIFVTSDAIALFTATTSLLMFLGILTSGYSEEDFLVSLPRKLIIGLITMFVSIASMVVAFGATIYMVLYNPWRWVIIPVALLGWIPVTSFAKMQFPLLVRIYSYTYAPIIS